MAYEIDIKDVQEIMFPKKDGIEYFDDTDWITSKDINTQKQIAYYLGHLLNFIKQPLPFKPDILIAPVSDRLEFESAFKASDNYSISLIVADRSITLFEQLSTSKETRQVLLLQIETLIGFAFAYYGDIKAMYDEPKESQKKLKKIANKDIKKLKFREYDLVCYRPTYDYIHNRLIVEGASNGYQCMLFDTHISKLLTDLFEETDIRYEYTLLSNTFKIYGLKRIYK